MENGEYRRYVGEDNRWRSEVIKRGLQLTTSFRNGLRFKKAGVPFRCRECEKSKPKSTRYLCKEYEKVCMDCAIKWIDGSIETFKEGIELLEKSRTDLLVNEKRWRREMILGAIN